MELIGGSLFFSKAVFIWKVSAGICTHLLKIVLGLIRGGADKSLAL
jgi:hypothetical protein